jgi:hypothetical protein
MSTTNDSTVNSDETLTPEEKGDIAEAGLEKLFDALRVWYVPLDAVIEAGPLLAIGPGEEKMRCPDYLTFTPGGALHEAKYRDYSRTWAPEDDSDETDERVYVAKDRWGDYRQHAEWTPVLLWVYVASESTWIRQSVADLSPVDDGVITVEDEHGDCVEKEVWWFSVSQFEEFSLLDLC